MQNVSLPQTVLCHYDSLLLSSIILTCAPGEMKKGRIFPHFVDLSIKAPSMFFVGVATGAAVPYIICFA